MDLGLFLMPLHPPEKPPADSLDEDLELVCRADELGFTEAWVGEHMSAKWEPIGAPDIFLAHAFPLTRRIRLGTGVFLLAIHHPVDVATRAALLDHISRGRFNLGVGTGSVPSDRPLKGIFAEPPELLDRFRESLEIILQLWEAEPPWRYEGKYWTVELADKWVDLEMGYPMRPYTQPHMPIGIPGFSPNSPSLFQAGKRGWYALSTNLTSNSVLGTHWATYKEGLEAGGHAVEPSGWRVAREVFVADTDKEALDYAVNGPMGEAFRRYMLPLCAKNVPGGLGTFKDDPDMPDADVTVEYLAHNVWLVGSPATIIEKIERFHDKYGEFGTLLMVSHDWTDPAPTMSSLSLLAKDVRPAFA